MSRSSRFSDYNSAPSPNARYSPYQARNSRRSSTSYDSHDRDSHSEPRYYQIGGFAPSLRWFLHNDKKLAESVFLSGSPFLFMPTPSSEPCARLVLGIRKSGTSHLLIPRDKAFTFATLLNAYALAIPSPSTSSTPTATRPETLTLPRSGYVVASEFESLSPIIFRSSEELRRKLASLKPRGGPWDNSSANKGFCDPGRHLVVNGGDRGEDSEDFEEKKLPHGVMRGVFEQGRVLYQCMLFTPTPSDLDEFALYHNFPQVIPNIRIFSFTFNRRWPDERRYQDKILSPSLVDMGWAELSFPGFVVKPDSVRHVVDKQNRLLRGKGAKLPFEHGTSQELDGDGISATLHEWIEAFTSPSQDHSKHRPEEVQPVLLLVVDKIVTLNIMRKYGVDVSRWETGLRDLLYSHSTQTSSQHRNPIYLIDVQQLYLKLAKTSYGSDAAGSISRSLKMPGAKEGYNAGNEAVLLIDIWRSMVSGPPIDEQDELRRQPNYSVSLAPLYTPAFQYARAGDNSDGTEQRPLLTDHDGGLVRALAELTEFNGMQGGEDEEEDPNDIVQVRGSAASAPAVVGTHHIWNAGGNMGGSVSGSQTGGTGGEHDGIRMYTNQSEEDDDEDLFE